MVCDRYHGHIGASVFGVFGVVGVLVVCFAVVGCGDPDVPSGYKQKSPGAVGEGGSVSEDEAGRGAAGRGGRGGAGGRSGVGGGAGKRADAGGAGASVSGNAQAQAGSAAGHGAGGVGAAAGANAGASAAVVGLDAVVVPAETADAEALKRLGQWQGLPLLAAGRFQQQSSRDRGQANADEEAALPGLAYGNRDLHNFVCKSADAQIGPTQLIAPHFDAASCAESYVHGVVLSRYEGSGELRRVWITASSLAAVGGTLGHEQLRIYSDDNPNPIIQVPLAQVLSGAAGEIFAPPFGSGAKNAIAWYYPVVFSSKLIVALDRLESEYYFQTDALLDDKPRPRTAPKQRLPERDQALALLTADAPTSAEATRLGTENIALAAGEQRIVQLEGPATIETLRLAVPKDKLGTLANVDISVRWDGASQPAISLPLLELLAAARAPTEKSSLALSAKTVDATQFLELRLPMPFKTNAEWLITNGGDKPVAFELNWSGAEQAPSALFGYLNVQRQQVALPASELEQTIADVSGRGRFVGVCVDAAGHSDPNLALTGSAPLNFLEGDFRATVDGKLALDSTGADEYADGAFYFLESPHATPFAQSWSVVSRVAAQPPGQASFCRWQVLGNEVDFQTGFKATIELSQHDPSLVDLYRSVAYLYVP